MDDGRPLSLREAMVRVSERGRTEGWPRSYYWSAVWLRLFSRESKNPRELLQHSRNQMNLYRDIESRRHHYQSLMRPTGLSDWQWFQRTKESA